MDLEELKQQSVDLRLKVRPDLSVEEASKMQIEVIQFASSLSWDIFKARMDEERASAAARAAYSKQFLLSTEPSDKKREAAARAHPDVKLAETIRFGAEAYRKLLEDYKQDFTVMHYALKAQLNATAQDKWAS